MGCATSSPGSGKKETHPYKDQRGTPFAGLLQRECLAVMKSSYFEDCLARGEAIQHRQAIDEKWKIPGAQALDMWDSYGFTFLVIVSYSWLSKAHPDPNMYHLKRLCRALQELKKYHNFTELGIIMDYCALWQWVGEEDPRTEIQLQQFGEGLKEINTPYGHRDVTAIKLTAVPEEERRGYDDRGWTLFESVVIDGKEPSAVRDPEWGELNVLSLGYAFDPDAEKTTGAAFVKKYSQSHRNPPLTPERFADEMETRRQRAEKKDVNLFTNGRDQPFVIGKYRTAFSELIKCEKMDFTDMEWVDESIYDLILVGMQCPRLKELHLTKNKLTRLPAKFVMMSKLQELYLSENSITALPDSVGILTSLKELHLTNNKLKSLPDTFGQLKYLKELHLSDNLLTILPESFGQLKSLSELHLDNNKLVALPESFGKLAFLEELHISKNAITKLPLQFGHLKQLRVLRLHGNPLEFPPLPVCEQGVNAISHWMLSNAGNRVSAQSDRA